MDTQQMKNILYNLTNLESAFKELMTKVNYNDYQTYQRFLNNFFIKQHSLQSVYWPNHSNHPGLHLPRFLTNFTDIKEDWIFLSDKIVLTKQLNLPFDHMLTNDFFQCVYVMEGCASLKLEGLEKLLHTGDFFVIFPGASHLLNSMDGSIVVNILIQKNHLYSEKFHIFEKHTVSNNDHSQPILSFGSFYQPDEFTYILFHTLENQDIHQIILQMFVEYLQKLNYKELVLDNYLGLLFAYLMRYQSEQIETSYIDTTQKVFNSIYQYCRLNIEHASLDRAAGELNYSKQYIGRVVKQITGTTFNTMLIKIKIDLTKKYLSETGLSLSYIAPLVGFSDASHLSRVFKAATGTTPSDYRAQSRKP